MELDVPSGHKLRSETLGLLRTVPGELGRTAVGLVATRMPSSAGRVFRFAGRAAGLELHLATPAELQAHAQQLCEDEILAAAPVIDRDEKLAFAYGQRWGRLARNSEQVAHGRYKTDDECIDGVGALFRAYGISEETILATTDRLSAYFTERADGKATVTPFPVQVEKSDQ